LDFFLILFFQTAGAAQGVGKSGGDGLEEGGNSSSSGELNLCGARSKPHIAAYVQEEGGNSSSSGELNLCGAITKPHAAYVQEDGGNSSSSGGTN
jgi:hypothetical protein